jgi:hypothetical protein
MWAGDGRGRYHLVEVTPEQHASRLAFLRSLCDAAREACAVRSCPRLAELPPERREAAVSVIGRHGLESVLLAAEPGSVLWTDDGSLAVLAGVEFKVERVWTQLVLNEVIQAGGVSQEEFEQCSARLLGDGYRFTWCNARIVLAAAEMANWQTEDWPLGAALDQLGEAGIDVWTRIRVGAEAIQAAWARAPSPFAQQGFLFGLLRRLGSVSTIHRLRQILPSFFGLDVLAARDVNTCIQLWLRQSGSVLRG